MHRKFLTGIICLAVLCLASLGAGSLAHAKPRPLKIVLDPGHGGSDHGATFIDGKTTFTEKEVTLAIAQAATKELALKGYEVILTRAEDADLSLPHRTEIANRLKADLFVSIHMNSSEAARSGDAKGIETYILNNASDASSHRLAYLENKGFMADAQSDVALILKDLRLDANLSESKRLACKIQGELANTSSTRSRGVKQALFYVLLGADMPSILLEAGFLNNSKDRKLATTTEGQLLIGRGLAEAVQAFDQERGTKKASTTLSTCKVR